MNRKIKWGIIGLGKIANKFAADLQLSESAELYAVASRSQEKANEFAHQYNAKIAYNFYEKLAKDPNVDVVYIATPHVFHYQNTLMCLKNGKHVLCEKPMGMNQDQVKEMMALAKEKGLFLMEGIWTRFHPAIQKVLELIHSKSIGDIIHLKADFGFLADYNPQKRLFNKKLGGGSLLDIGLYPVYLSLLLLGKPIKIDAKARFTQTGVDDFCTINFEYGNRVHSALESTLAMQTPTEANIHGTKGSIKIHSRFHESTKVALYKSGEATIYDFNMKGNGYYYEIEEVNQCLNAAALESKKLPLSISLALAQTLDLIREKIGLEY